MSRRGWAWMAALLGGALALDYRRDLQAQRQRVQQAVRQLAAAEARLASLRHVLQQRQRAEQRVQQRHEQKETDEWAMQRHARGIGRQLTQGI